MLVSGRVPDILRVNSNVDKFKRKPTSKRRLLYKYVVYLKFASEYNEDLTPRKSQKKGQRLF